MVDPPRQRSPCPGLVVFCALKIHHCQQLGQPKGWERCLEEATPCLPFRSGSRGPSHRERVFPTFQGFLQGLHKAGQAVAVTVIPARILTPRQDQGCQVKVHKGQVVTSHLRRGETKQQAQAVSRVCDSPLTNSFSHHADNGERSPGWLTPQGLRWFRVGFFCLRHPEDRNLSCSVSPSPAHPHITSPTPAEGLENQAHLEMSGLGFCFFPSKQ